MWKASLFGLLVLFLVLACSDRTTQAGGGIWDETENSLAIRILDAAGNPVPQARVRLVSTQSWATQFWNGQSPVQDSSLTNSAGQARLMVKNWPVQLEVLQNGKGLRSLLQQSDSTWEGQIVPVARLHGSLAAKAQPWPDSLYLLGTSFHAVVDAKGYFIFDSLPPGSYSIASRHAAFLQLWGEVHLQSDSLLQIADLAPQEQDSVLLDDFEDGTAANRFHAITGAGWWFHYSDSSSRVIPQSVASSSVSNGWMGSRSYQVSFQMGNAENHFALAGFDYGSSPLGDSQLAQHDLSKLDSLSFWAQGKGIVHVQFVSLLPSPTGKVSQTMSIVLQEHWSRVVIRPQDLPSKNGYAWSDLAAHQTSLAFMSNDHAELWIDQIQLHGLSIQDLYPQLRKP